MQSGKLWNAGRVARGSPNFLAASGQRFCNSETDAGARAGQEYALHQISCPLERKRWRLHASPNVTRNAPAAKIWATIPCSNTRHGSAGTTAMSAAINGGAT